MRNIAWHPRVALLGAVATVPAALIIATGRVSSGLGFAIGVLPAALIGVAPTIRQRARVIVAGALFGAFLVIGSLVGHNDAVAVVAMFALPVLAALLAARRPIGNVVLSLGLPLTAVGLSFGDVGDAVGAAIAIVLGSAFSFALSCFTRVWPQSAPQPRRAAGLLQSERALAYGISLSLAGGSRRS